jgi:hypothetical protein
MHIVRVFEDMQTPPTRTIFGFLYVHIAPLGRRSAFYIGNKFGIAPTSVARRKSYPFREVWIALLENVRLTTTDNSRYVTNSRWRNDIRRR